MPAPLIGGKFTVTFGNAGDVLVLNADLGNRRCARCQYRSCCDYGCYNDDQLHCSYPPVGGPIGRGSFGKNRIMISARRTTALTWSSSQRGRGDALSIVRQSPLLENCNERC